MHASGPPTHPRSWPLPLPTPPTTSQCRVPNPSLSLSLTCKLVSLPSDSCRGPSKPRVPVAGFDPRLAPSLSSRNRLSSPNQEGSVPCRKFAPRARCFRRLSCRRLGGRVPLIQLLAACACGAGRQADRQAHIDIGIGTKKETARVVWGIHITTRSFTIGVLERRRAATPWHSLLQFLLPCNAYPDVWGQGITHPPVTLTSHSPSSYSPRLRCVRRVKLPQSSLSVPLRSFPCSTSCVRPQSCSTRSADSRSGSDTLPFK